MKNVFFAFLIIAFLLIKGKPMTDQIKAALQEIKDTYGEDTARKVEQIFRKETAHFTSRGFKLSLSPGMEKHSNRFPYGWTSLRDLWMLKPSLAPVDTVTMRENVTGKEKTFLRFASVRASMLSLAVYLQKYPAGRWYSTDPDLMARYENEMQTIVPRITKTLA